MSKQRTGLIDYEPFFYPLDRILQWNRLYGKQGCCSSNASCPGIAGPWA